MNIFNDSGTECSAHIQRPANSNLTYHFLCKIKAILNFYGIFNDGGAEFDGIQQIPYTGATQLNINPSHANERNFRNI